MDKDPHEMSDEELIKWAEKKATIPSIEFIIIFIILFLSIIFYFVM